MNVWAWLAAGVVGGVFWVVVGGSGLEAEELFTEVVITEVQWDGVEYVQLDTIGGELVDLTGWSLRRQRREGEAATTLVVFEEAVVVTPGESLVVGREGAGLPIDVLAPSLVLHNDGNIVELVDGNGDMVDSVGQLGPWFAGTNTEIGIPMVRVDWEAPGTEAGNWRDKRVAGASVMPPGEEDSDEEVFEPKDETESIETVKAVVRISEVLPNPKGSDAEGEFVELFNSGGAALDISGWQIDDGEGGSKPYVIVEGMMTGGQYVVWSREVTGLAFNNEGDMVRLLSPEGDVVLVMSYGGEAKEGWSWNWVEGLYVVSEKLTPGLGNVIVQPQPSPARRVEEENKHGDRDDVDFSEEIVISSFLPNPKGVDGEGEFVEIKNEGTVVVRLEGWQLDDMEGGSTPYDLEGELAAGERRKFWRQETNLALNNNGDMVRLIDPVGLVVAEVEYGVAGEGDVFEANEDGEYVTGMGAGEVLGVKEEILSVAQARSVEEGAEVIVEGVVVVPPGVLGGRVMYIADEDGVGLQVYWSHEWPDVEWWQRVRLMGIMGEAYGERRLRLGVVGPEIVGSAEEVNPQGVATGEIGEEREGELVRIEGEVKQTSGATLYVDDGSGEVRVVVKAETEIEKPRMRVGMRVVVVGMVSETQSGYRILPRRQEDFMVVESVVEVEEHNSSSGVVPLDTKIVLNSVEENLSLPRLELPSFVPTEQYSWTMEEDQRKQRKVTQNTLVLVGLGLAAVQLVGGAREGEPLWKRKS